MKKFLVLAVAVLATMISFNLLAECTGLSFDSAMDYQKEYDDNGDPTGNYYPSMLVSFSLSGFAGELEDGYLSFEFYSGQNQNANWETVAAAVGTYDLGSGNNANYSSCNQCVRLYRYVYDETAEDWAYDKQFYQQEGKLQIKHTDFVANDHYYYNGVLSVKLAEATISEDGSYTSSFVPNGECYEIESAAWTVYPEGSEPADDADTGDTGSSDPADTGDDTGSEPTEPGEDTDSEPTEPGEDTDADGNNNNGGNNNNNGNNGNNNPTDPNNNNNNYYPQSNEDDGGCALVIL